MLLVKGRIEVAAAQRAAFTGHRALLTFLQREPVSDSAGVELPGAASAEIDREAAFTLQLPDRDAIAGPLEAAVLAPTGVVLSRATLPLSALDAELVLHAKPSQPFAVGPPDGPDAGRLPRLSGRVIDSRGETVSPGLPVVLWGVAADPAGEPPAPLLATLTQLGGYFAGPWPDAPLSRAFGTVQGGPEVPIRLEDGRLPRRVILVVEAPAPADNDNDSDCGCDPLPPRQPGQADLTGNPAAFSQDLGGRCADLTMPNRVLEEFSYFMVVRTTEPDVRPVSLAPPRRLPPDVIGYVVGVASTQRAALPEGQRLMLPGPDEVPDGDGVRPVGGGLPTATEAANLLATVDGRALQELLLDPTAVTLEGLQQVALASEARDVARLVDLIARKQPVRHPLTDPIPWDAAPTLYEATSVALGHVLHYRQEWLADGFSLGDLLSSLPLAPGQKRQVAVIDWERRETAQRTELLEDEESLQALAERDRDISEIVGTHLDERIDAASNSSTWAAGGGIGAGFIGTGFGVFGGVAGGASGADSSSWQDAARQLGGSSMQQIRDRTTQRASSLRDQRSTVVQTMAQGEQTRAETEVVANHNHCHALTMEYFEVLRHFQVTLELAQVTECVFVPLPMRPFDQAKALRWRTPLLASLRDRDLAGGFDAMDRIAVNWVGWDYPEHRYSEEAPEVLEGELRVSFILPRPLDDKDGQFQVDAWDWLTPLLDTSALALWNAQLAAREQAERDQYFRDAVAPGLAEQLVRRLQFAYVTRSGVQVPVTLDATLVSRFQEGVPLYVSIRPAGPVTPLAREDIARFRVFTDDLDLPPDARVLVHSGRMRYDTAHLTHLLFDAPRMENDLARTGSVIVATPTDQDELRDPRDEDRRLADRLVRHLNEHLEYYHQAIWVSMDGDRRYMLLDGAVAPNAGGRSVASVVENRLIGVVGNCLVLPVTPGIHLDPTLAPDEQTGAVPNLRDAYASDLPEPLRVSVPTRGVYAEAVMGACNSCEIKDDTRFWRWEESPNPDEPTPIQTLSTDSRAAPEPNLTPTPLPQPLISIQNAPALPDPVGLSDALQVLGRSDVFRDPTGLAGTQRNALSAFQGAMDTAKLFGGQAARLAQQQEVGRNVDRTLQQIQQARQSGLLTQQQAQDLAHGVLQQLVGAPDTAERSPLTDPTVSGAIDAATQAGAGSVSVTTPGESVETTFNSGDAAAVGASSVSSKPLEPWVGVGHAPDYFTSNAPPYGYQVDLPIYDVDGLRGKANLRIVRDVLVADAWDALVAAGFLRVDPAFADRFQLKLRMQITFPADARHPDTVDGTGKLPLVVIAHGHHQGWIPTGYADTGTTVTGGDGVTRALFKAGGIDDTKSYTGYTYLQEELARNGIISVSVDQNFANFFEALIETRAGLVKAALDALWAEAHNPDSKYFDRIDFERIGLVGHSRGGDAVVRAAQMLVKPSQYVIKAVVGLAPTDWTGGDEEAKRIALGQDDAGFYLCLYGALDGDVTGVATMEEGFRIATSMAGTGFRTYDRATCARSMVFVDGCCHNGFNTQWWADGPDFSGSGLLDEDSHHRIAIDYIGDLMRWQLNGEALSGRLNGRVANRAGAAASLQWRFGTAVKQVEDFEHGSKNLLGGSHATVDIPPATVAIEDLETITVGGEPLELRFVHRTHVLHADLATAIPATSRCFTTNVPSTDADWSSYDTLLVSLAGWFDPTSASSIGVAPLPRVKVTLIDGGGGAGTVDWTQYGATLPSRPIFKERADGANLTLEHKETIPIALALFAGADLTKVKQVAIDVDPGNGTHVFVDDVHVVKV